MSEKRSNLINVGRLAGVFGVKGWIKVTSYTEPKENILNYSPWWLKTRHGVKPFEVEEYKFQNDGLIVHFKGIDDRDVASQYNLIDIAVERGQLPELEEGEFYWHELVGLSVVSQFEGKEYELGNVKRLMETGANDVLVISPSDTSFDEKERLVPYVPDLYVESVNMEAGEITVLWDPEF